MAKKHKSPQEKKELEYMRDHFTFGWHSSREFPKTWKRKKAHANRSYRRQSESLLAKVKPQMEAGEVEPLADDLTAVRFRKGISRKRLHKTGTVNLGEKVKQKLERREKNTGRKTRLRQRYDLEAASAIRMLVSLTDEELNDFVHRLELRFRSQKELRPRLSLEANRALDFAHGLILGSAWEAEALARNPDLASAWRIWLAKARRVLKRERNVAQRKNNRKDLFRLSRRD